MAQQLRAAVVPLHVKIDRRAPLVLHAKISITHIEKPSLVSLLNPQHQPLAHVPRRFRMVPMPNSTVLFDLHLHIRGLGQRDPPCVNGRRQQPARRGQFQRRLPLEATDRLLQARFHLEPPILLLFLGLPQLRTALVARGQPVLFPQKTGGRNDGHCQVTVSVTDVNSVEHVKSKGEHRAHDDSVLLQGVGVEPVVAAGAVGPRFKSHRPPGGGESLQIVPGGHVVEGVGLQRYDRGENRVGPGPVPATGCDVARCDGGDDCLHHKPGLWGPEHHLIKILQNLPRKPQ
mmetsp:Transcript_92313/g.211308  ORF Transcript_92313/g.211308 Transcript_92313/m.211308 type:complete len:288 (-) Transcript_92313:331-1194(-)